MTERIVIQNWSKLLIEIRIADNVKRALEERSPVVALESTVIAHGLPYPLNVETALTCEEAVRSNGATPATIGIVEGAPVIGLSEYEIDVFAGGKSPYGNQIQKVGLNNLAAVMINRGWGATTVASTLKLARVAGIRVFSTGGIGGVHRGAAESFDVSADLTALGGAPLVCVCAGAKAVLDLPKTLECLETLGVPVIGYGTDEFPAFYSRSSGLSVDESVDTPARVAEIAECQWRFYTTAVLVCVPVPAEFEIPSSTIESAVDEAMSEAARAGVRGKSVTPFLLSEMERLTGGRTLQTNRALLVNNAGVAARIASSLCPS
jgi:pseudouridine-5'-phosphate glycosidase